MSADPSAALSVQIPESLSMSLHSQEYSCAYVPNPPGPGLRVGADADADAGMVELGLGVVELGLGMGMGLDSWSSPGSTYTMFRMTYVADILMIRRVCDGESDEFHVRLQIHLPYEKPET